MSLDCHRLPQDLFQTMAAGGGGQAAMEILKQAERSKHALLLLGVVTTAERVSHGQAALARRAYELLADAQGRDPSAVDAVMSHSSVGAWAYRTTVALRGGPGMPGAEPGALACVSAAAAIRAGVAAEIEVPVSAGIVTLPTLGVAGPFDGHMAVVRTGPTRTEVIAKDVRVIIPPDSRDRAGGWRPLRQISMGQFELLLDDFDPFRMPAAPNLTPVADADGWSAVFRQAWALLEEHHPAVAAEVACLIRVIVPLEKPARGQVSSSSPETFGTIALSEPLSACLLASTLAHEVQHVKLSALLDLVPLTRPDDERRFFAPWREDPRPISGLLQGAYAYVGVTGFWRRQRELGSEIDADVEFARWREAAALAAETLQASGQLTAAGETFVRGMRTTLREWQNEPLPHAAQLRANAANARHMARWQSRYGPIPLS